MAAPIKPTITTDHKHYVAGQVVSGRVCVDVSSPADIAGIQLLLIGREEAQWPAVQLGQQVHGQQRDFFHHTPILFPPSFVGLSSLPVSPSVPLPKSEVLDTGSHTFPFSVRLPVPLPWSCNCIQQVGQSIVTGSVKFDIFARIFTAGKTISTSIIELFVGEVFDKFPRAFPTKTSRQVRSGDFFPSPITLTMQLESMAAHMGDKLVAVLTVDNQLRRKGVGDIKMWLVQDTMFRAGPLSNTTQLILANYTIPESVIGPRSTYHNTLHLPVPVPVEMWGVRVDEAARMEWERRGSQSIKPEAVAGAFPTTSLMGSTLSVPSDVELVKCGHCSELNSVTMPAESKHVDGVEMLCYSCRHAMRVPRGENRAPCGDCGVLNALPQSVANTTPTTTTLTTPTPTPTTQPTVTLTPTAPIPSVKVTEESTPSTMSAAAQAIAGALGATGAMETMEYNNDELSDPNAVEMRPITRTMTRQASAVDPGQLAAVELEDIFVADVYEEEDVENETARLLESAPSAPSDVPTSRKWFKKKESGEERQGLLS